MKVMRRPFLLGICNIVITLAITSCSAQAKKLPVAILSERATPEFNEIVDGELDATPTSAITPTMPLLKEQANQGYQEAEKRATQTATAQPTLSTFEFFFASPKYDIAWTYHEENSQKEQIAAVVRKLSEEKDSYPGVLAMVGATSNEDSMRLASLAKLFSVPVMIPSVTEDNALPAENSWAFRLSAPDTKYAEYFFTKDVLNPTNIDRIIGSTKRSINIAIFYEQTTFGESAAVAAANQVMKKDNTNITVSLYHSFDPLNPENAASQVGEYQNEIIQRASNIDTRIHIVYIISNQPEVAQKVTSLLRQMEAISPSMASTSTPAATEELLEEEESNNSSNTSTQSIAPIILGYSGAFTTRSFIQNLEESSTREDQPIYILRQKIYPESPYECPAEISNYLPEAQRFSAWKILETIIQKSAKESGFLDAPIAKKRDMILKKLQEREIKDSGCLGPVFFDNGQNTNLSFELVKFSPETNEFTVEPIESFIETIKAGFSGR